MSTDHFAHKAATYEQDRGRVDNVARIAQAIQAVVALRPDMRLMDFGAGTGLLLERLAPHVAHITAVDASPAMSRQLEEKRATLACPVDLVQGELEHVEVPGPFDGIVSSMTLHHVRDVAALLQRFHGLLREGGFIALADLEAEDGSFHSHDHGVFHHGFTPDALAASARQAGFQQVGTTRASVVRKDRGDYPVFLLTGWR